MRINPIAVMFWIFAGLIGFIITNTFKGFAIGVACLMAVSIIVSFIEDR